MAFLTEDGAPLGYGYGGGKRIVDQVGQVDEHQTGGGGGTEKGFDIVVEEAAAELGLNIQPDYEPPKINDGARWLAG